MGLVTLVLGEIIGGALPGWFRSSAWLMGSLPPWISFWLAHQPGSRSYQLALLLAGIISGPGLIPLFMLSKNRPTQASRSERGDSIQNLRKDGRIHVWAQFIAPALSPRTYRDAIHNARRLVQSPVFFLVLVWVCIGLGAGLYVPYFNIFFVQHLGASPALFGLIDGGANLITALLTLLAPWLALRIGKVNTMVWTRLLSIPMLLTIGLTNLLPLAAILYLFRQGTMDMSVGILQVFSMEAVSEKRRGLANSSYQASYQAALGLTTPIGGLLIVRVGYPPIFLLGALCFIVAMAVLWWRFGHGVEQDRQMPERVLLGKGTLNTDTAHAQHTPPTDLP